MPGKNASQQLLQAIKILAEDSAYYYSSNLFLELCNIWFPTIAKQQLLSNATPKLRRVNTISGLFKKNTEVIEDKNHNKNFSKEEINYASIETMQDEIASIKSPSTRNRRGSLVTNTQGKVITMLTRNVKFQQWNNEKLCEDLIESLQQKINGKTDETKQLELIKQYHFKLFKWLAAEYQQSNAYQKNDVSKKYANTRAYILSRALAMLTGLNDLAANKFFSNEDFVQLNQKIAEFSTHFTVCYWLMVNEKNVGIPYIVPSENIHKQSDIAERFIFEKNINENKLGEGSFGSVYKGKNSQGEIVVAKIFNSTADGIKEFEVEANILRFLFEECQKRDIDPQAYFVSSIGHNCSNQMIIFPYMSGGSLQDLMEAQWEQHQQPFTADMQKSIVRDLVEGLRYLHSNGVAHRDVKPDNVLISWKDKVMVCKLADFGCAQTYQDDDFEDDTKIKVFTRFQGTANFSAPEALIEEIYLPEKGDVFSLGALIYEMLNNSSMYEDLFALHEITVNKQATSMFSEYQRIFKEYFTECSFTILNPNLKNVELSRVDKTVLQVFTAATEFDWGKRAELSSLGCIIDSPNSEFDDESQGNNFQESSQKSGGFSFDPSLLTQSLGKLFKNVSSQGIADAKTGVPRISIDSTISAHEQGFRK